MSKQKKSYSSVGTIITSDNEALSHIVLKTQKLLKLQKELLSVLDPEIRGHCYLANFENGILFLAAESNVWATRLRFATPDLLKKLKPLKGFKDLNSIQCAVMMDDKNISSRKATPIEMNRENAEHLKALAKTIKNEKLKKSLLNLAKDTSA